MDNVIHLFRWLFITRNNFMQKVLLFKSWEQEYFRITETDCLLGWAYKKPFCIFQICVIVRELLNESPSSSTSSSFRPIAAWVYGHQLFSACQHILYSGDHNFHPESFKTTLYIYCRTAFSSKVDQIISLPSAALLFNRNTKRRQCLRCCFHGRFLKLC